MNKETILGVQVSKETYSSITDKLFNLMGTSDQAFIVAVNPEKIMKAAEDPELKDLINAADYQIPDGIGILIASRLQKGSVRDRITGIDLMQTLVAEAEKREKKIFLYGGKPGVADKAAAQIQLDHPKINIAGTINGYEKDEEKIIETINAANPDILFVALGSPKQEEWIKANKQRLNVSVFQGVGGSFDVIAGNIKRAPKIFIKFGLEWLYRLLIEPWRIKRQLALPKFLLKVFSGKK
ncbi:WecB/TagA/CpsF family glycosyltransferase [Gracilibacillus caseinilyticus]|uniref:N-acetylglucosaminyldiphosphoundecaprenol N-acetyl-beta-D-mannosaminyltransferase n=1 Tax=Gracilibacillus caseinilyticus TaxID=2932256 RepID=A0ABY4F1D0_9BACI|nr:WecB/TagA/CpsF family glycosyltransferase [Gracilibacillus caseinilyticus]UOQ50284.1 WecB/TagA/CpsF family glycosyltransferase [Gracilibacillus caseinilyticus]